MSDLMRKLLIVIIITSVKKKGIPLSWLFASVLIPVFYLFICSGVITMESNTAEAQCVTLDVMPLVAGYLPLPTVRLSKYIAANTKGKS